MQHLLPLDGAVAPHAGIGGVPGKVVVDEVVDDLFAEDLREIHRVVGEAQLHRNTAGIVDAVQGAAR